MSYCPRSSLPVEVLAWLAGRLAHLTPPRPPGRGGTPPLALEVRLDAVAAVLLDGLSGLAGVLDAASVAAILDRGFRGMARPREHWHAPLGIGAPRTG